MRTLLLASGKIENIPESVRTAEESVKAEGNEAHDQLQCENAYLGQAGLRIPAGTLLHRYSLVVSV